MQEVKSLQMGAKMKKIQNDQGVAHYEAKSSKSIASFSYCSDIKTLGATSTSIAGNSTSPNGSLIMIVAGCSWCKFQQPRWSTLSLSQFCRSHSLTEKPSSQGIK